MKRVTITPEQMDHFKAIYPHYTNAELAAMTGFSKRTFDQFSQRFGIKKCEKHIQKLNTEKSHFYHYPKKR